MTHSQAPLMLVGDDVSFCYLMQRYAQQGACPLMTVHFAEDVLSRVLAETPPAVILELDFLGGRGWEVLNVLRTHPEARRIPIILCAWADDAERSLDEGVALCLRKPILYADFRAALAEVGIDL